MKVNNWKYKIIDIAEYPPGVKVEGETVLANSVNACNYDLIKVLKPGDNILEIGCGCLSYLLDNLPDGVFWEAIDVMEKDRRGRKVIATRMGSVHEIPYKNCSFGFVLANQSMEHWFEYKIKINDALGEIARVLKVGGEAHLNFPFHLHGHSAFVTGDLNAIIGFIDKEIWEICEIIAYEDSSESDYPGWRRCKFPDQYVRKYVPTKTSYVVNIVLKKVSDAKDALIEDAESRTLKLTDRKSTTQLALAHGGYVFMWKLWNKLFASKIHRKS